MEIWERKHCRILNMRRIKIARIELMKFRNPLALKLAQRRVRATFPGLFRAYSGAVLWVYDY